VVYKNIVKPADRAIFGVQAYRSGIMENPDFLNLELLQPRFYSFSKSG